MRDGQTSCKDCSLVQLGQALTELRRFAVSSGRREGWRKPSSRAQIRLIFSLWWKLGRDGKLRSPQREWHRSLRAFIKKKTSVEDPNWLLPELVSKVIGILKNMNARPAKLPSNAENADPEAA